MTARIKPNLNPGAQAKELLAEVKKKTGSTPNIFTTLAHSPAALSFLLNGTAILNTTKITPALREQIALTVAGANHCDYCASAHTAIGKMHKIPEAELTQNLIAKSKTSKIESALKFARQIVDLRGHVSSSDLEAIREAGYSEEEIIEIIAVVCHNIFTNYFNHIAETEIDFPKVTAALAHT